MKKNNVCFILIICGTLLQSALMAQFPVSGKVMDSRTRSVLAGATIRIDGTMLGCISGPSGKFEFRNMRPGTYVIRASYLGYEPAELKAVVRNLDDSIQLEFRLIPSEIVSEAVIIQGIRAPEGGPVAQTTLDKDDLKKNNNGQDFPFLLNMAPSVVVTSDAGAGIGYTGIRIRGSDPTRVNITFNGIPYNDSESQGTYWVDLPDFASSVNNVQIQRGVGTSTNGAGAFGASVNIMTDALDTNAFAEVTNVAGSFNTWRHTLKAGTGLIADKFSVQTRLSKISSDGYVDNAWSDLQSWFVTAGYYGKKNMLKAVLFSGKERTYQAWYGVGEDSLATNRTFNLLTYDNEVDDYRQDHYQLHFTQEIFHSVDFHAAAHYTRGYGYYEQFRFYEPLAAYGLDPVITGADTIFNTDLIRRRWLDNDFYGLTWNLSAGRGKVNQTVVGGAANHYEGRHFGEIIWARFSGAGEIRYRYYENEADKNDINLYLKHTWTPLNGLSLYADFQYRVVSYSFLGFDDTLANVQQDVSMFFINPKCGLNYRINDKDVFHAYFGVANREPSRDDYVASSPGSRPLPENLFDAEAGYRRRSRDYAIALNGYYMYYCNQLVLTGQVNDVGAYTRTNTSRSYRAGLEAEAEFRIHDDLAVGGNLTLSQNKILNFDEYTDNYDTGNQEILNFRNPDISFSPSVISALFVSIRASKGVEIRFQSKFVGRQYLDNTSNPGRSINPYTVTDGMISYAPELKWIRELRLNFWLNNIFGENYESNGYTYGYVFGGGREQYNYYFPQAGRNFLAGITLGF